MGRELSGRRIPESAYEGGCRARGYSNWCVKNGAWKDTQEMWWAFDY